MMKPILCAADARLNNNTELFHEFADAAYINEAWIGYEDRLVALVTVADLVQRCHGTANIAYAGIGRGFYQDGRWYVCLPSIPQFTFRDAVL